ncbi:uncharacterized protein LOC141657799 isoform X2 [Silene latifolia]|uniref:uncharacterized protein LOC141657799 isoform X2 n=1 Tax=Silene latifolia TaxID=37657 RepID=UPI003D76B3C1
MLPYDPESESEVSCSQKNKTKKKKPKAMKCNSDSLSGAKFPLDTVSPSRKKPTRAETKEPLEDMFGEKLNLGKDADQLEKNKATECKEVPEDFLSRSEGKLPLGQVSSSQKKSDATKPKENLENDVFRSGEKVPEDSLKLEPDEYLDYFPQHYVVGWNGIKVYTEVTRPKKKKKPKAIKIKENRRFGEKREDLEDCFFRESEEMEKTSRKFACAALSYLRERGHNLELVKPCLYEVGEVTHGYRAHFNFKAKRKDDPSAPVEMYFGQLCYYGETEIVVECCVSLGESDSLPYDPEDRGCQYCTNTVHHPLGGCKGIVWGLLTFSNKTRSFTIA